MSLENQLHYLLTQYVIDHGHVPALDHLARLADCDPGVLAQGLQDLAAIRGVILEPHSLRVWSLHPFAMIPTAHWVSIGDRGWWANCAWCSLAIGSALQQQVTITTSDGAEREKLEFTAHGRETSRSDLLMHFPYPPARWWDNPYCPCGNILFFSSEARIDEWSKRHGRPKGAILEMPKALALADLWFGDYASPAWTRKTPEQAQAIFSELGLDPDFWRL
jgi:hypothetical protein